MTSSLVGSEMCIRDRPQVGAFSDTGMSEVSPPEATRVSDPCESIGASVSYTHLTLPTICSV
eukprot:7796482-Prorocentrum_lima.AAC.1